VGERLGKIPSSPAWRTVLLLAAAIAAAACGAVSAPANSETIPSGAGPNGPKSIDPADFTARVDNPYFPLRPGTTFRYRGTKDAKPTVDVFRVSHRVRRIAGVPCVAVKDHLYEAGRLEERTTDWYSQDRQNRVWYFGESTAELNPAGKITSTEGSWETGANGALPGLFMPAAPRPGQSFRQEYLKGEAEDHFRVITRSAPITVPAGSFPKALLTREWTPLEPGVIDHKYYVRGIGEVSEETVKGPAETSKLVSVTGGR
jgi:hypothetical protein